MDNSISTPHFAPEESMKLSDISREFQSKTGLRLIYAPYVPKEPGGKCVFFMAHTKSVKYMATLHVSLIMDNAFDIFGYLCRIWDIPVRLQSPDEPTPPSE